MTTTPNTTTLAAEDDLDYLQLRHNHGLIQLFDSFAPLVVAEDSSHNGRIPEERLLYSRRGCKCRPPTVSTPRTRGRSRGGGGGGGQRTLSDMVKLAHEPPTPGCIVVSSLAVYFFPPEQYVDDISYVPLISYERHLLDDILFVSLPYKEMVNDQGEEFSLRTDDMVLHFNEGASMWLRTEANGRSELVQVIADAYEALKRTTATAAAAAGDDVYELDIRSPHYDSLALQLDALQRVQLLPSSATSSPLPPSSSDDG